MAKEKRIVIAFGRFNPPTTGHERLVTFLTRTANRLGADARVYASPTTDAKKNPLPFQEKVRFLRQLFPRVTFNDNPAMNTPFAAYADASAAGYKDITVIVGADRVRDFEKFGAYLLPAGSSKYNAAKHIDVSQYRVLAIPRGAGAISATLMRGYAAANDFPSFLAGTPGRNTTVAKKIFTSLRRHMRIREQKAYRKAMQQKVMEAQDVQVEGPFGATAVKYIDKRARPPIPEHPFHKLDNAKLAYIQKDAALAAKAVRGHDRRAETKYLDQVNDVTTILNYRRRGGKQFKEATDKLSRPASVSQQMQAAKIIAKSLTGSESRGLTGTGWKKTPHEIIDDAVRHFLKGRHTPKAWHIAGKMLNKATLLGIKWNQKLIRPTTRKAMKMDEEILKPGTRIKIPRPKKGSRFYKDLRGKIIRYDKGDNVYVVDVGMSGPERVAVSRVVKEDKAKILAPGTRVKIPGRQGGRGKVVRHDKGDRHGSPFYIVDVGKYASEKVPAHDVVREADGSRQRPTPELPSEVDRLKVRQTTDLLTLKQRQASELMAAKIRDVETKAREAQRKATAPKGAAVSAS